MRIKPLGERVLIKPLKEETKSVGGIVLPENAKEKPQRAEVIEVGTSDDITVKVGDTVIFAKYSGNEIKIDDEDYILIEWNDILAKVEK
jgi:chaperonin GroES|uniref:Co-chaperonin GroES n=1 Tax=Mesoaciditoga lauensis TaxID=1495039 RepID=A0A7V3RD57_9BACT